MTQFKKEQNKHLNRIKCVNSRENANDWKLEKEVNFFCFWVLGANYKGIWLDMLQQKMHFDMKN